MAACGGRQLMTGGYKRERDIHSTPHYAPLCTSMHPTMHQYAPVCILCTSMLQYAHYAHHYAHHYAPVCIRQYAPVSDTMHQYAHHFAPLCTSMHTMYITRHYVILCTLIMRRTVQCTRMG